MRLTHVRVLVDDYGACFRFYRDILGLELTFGDEHGPYASFATGDAGLSIFERGPQSETVELRAPGDGTLVVLEVDDVDAEAERLRRHVLGQTTSRPDWGIRVCYLRDPDGNLLELHSPLPST